jgi:hypothetical protein
VGGGIEAVDVGAAGVVDEVLLGGADEVAKLVVTGRVSVSVGGSGRARARADEAHAMGIFVGKYDLEGNTKASVSRLLQQSVW